MLDVIYRPICFVCLVRLADLVTCLLATYPLWCHVDISYILACLPIHLCCMPRCLSTYMTVCTTQKAKFSIKNFSSKCDQIHSFLRIWSHLLKKSLMENLIFCAVFYLIFPVPNVSSLTIFSLLYITT